MVSIYMIQIILILVYGYLFRDNKKRFLIVAFLVLFVVMAFRHARMVGYDSSSSYLSGFQQITNRDLSWPNPGLQVIMKIIARLGGDYQWFIIVTATWVCLAYYKLLIKYSENGFISVMWFMGMLFYVFLFDALKQAWAMALLCFAFDAVLEKKPIRFLVLVGIAALFHFPALIFLPAFWIAKLKINRAFPILMLSIFVIVFIFRTQILNLMTSAYSRGETEYSSDVRFIGTKFVFMVLMLAYGFYRYILKEKNADHNRLEYSVLLYYMGIAAVIQTFCFFSNNFERLADYYYQFSILYVPLILSSKDYSYDNTGQLNNNYNVNSDGTLVKKRIRNYSINDIDINTVLTIIVTIFCVWRFVSHMNNDVCYSPFYFFWQNVNISMRFR